MTSIYLAGPIDGCSYAEAANWREDVKRYLSHYGITCYSPLRYKDYLKEAKSITGHYEQTLGTQQAIMSRDFFDCKRSDLIFVNFLGSKKASIGTAMEVAWAYALQKPLLVCMEKEGNPHDHAMIRQVIGWRVTTLEEGKEIAKAILLP